MSRAPPDPSAVQGVAYPPELFVAVHRGTPGDVDFYRRACSGARSVLELGSGAGRIAVALAADGLDVVGIERDPELLALAPASGATLRAGDMRDFALGRRFDRVLVPYNGIYCLTSEHDLLACLGCVRKHLAPEGLLVFDAYAADPFHEGADASAGDWDELGEVAVAHAGGHRWRVLEQSRWWPDEQRIEARYVHLPEDGGTPTEALIEQRYLLGAQVAPLLAHAGLDLVALLGGFDQHAYDPEESDRLIAVARPAVG